MIYTFHGSMAQVCSMPEYHDWNPLKIKDVMQHTDFEYQCAA